jgi:hypothetical protein
VEVAGAGAALRMGLPVGDTAQNSDTTQTSFAALIFSPIHH